MTRGDRPSRYSAYLFNSSQITSRQIHVLSHLSLELYTPEPFVICKAPAIKDLLVINIIGRHMSYVLHWLDHITFKIFHLNNNKTVHIMNECKKKCKRKNCILSNVNVIRAVINLLILLLNPL